MNYTHVEVLKPVPGFPVGKYPIEREHIKSEIAWFSMRQLKQCTDFFRLYSEPQFEVGGYAKAVEDCHRDLKAGKIYPIEGPDCDSWIRVKAETGLIDCYLVRNFTPATREEYEAQEEAKKPWRPGKGEKHYYINTSGTIIYPTTETPIQEDRNCFRTREAAEYFRDHYLKPAFDKYAQDYPNLPQEVK